MSATFEMVPAEILQDVCAILDTVHPDSLLAFARASKHCYAVASTALFRTIKLGINDPEDEQAPFQFVHGMETRLLRDDAFKHVRRLIICDPQNCVEFPDWRYAGLKLCEKGVEEDTGLFSFWDTCKSQWYPHETVIADQEWDPVIQLVERLPGLVDFYWICQEQLPPRLLKILNSKAGICRLHHYTFNLGSSSERHLSSYDQALITSPCLYSIAQLDHDNEPLESAWSLRSPNLRKVHLCFSNFIGGQQAQTVRQPVPREVIHMEGSGLQSAPHLFTKVQAEAFGDFSALRVLALKHPIHPDGLPAASEFPSLSTLTFTCPVDDSVTQLSWDTLATFLRNLPRLTTLLVQDWHRSISFTTAINPKLRALELRTCGVSRHLPLRDDHVHRLADLCPNLETLHLEIRRTRGDAAEVARYRSLGRLPRLQELMLTLDPSPAGLILATTDSSHDIVDDTAIEPWFDAQDAEYLRGTPYREGHVRDALVNSAIDEDLARSIFQVISDGKPRSSGRPSPLPLERLRVSAWEGGHFPQSGTGASIHFSSSFHSLFYALNQHWMVERDVRDDARDVIRVPEVNRQLINKNSCQETKFDLAKDKQDWLGIWRRVWPVENEGVDWWKDWKSRPLALDDGGSRGVD